MLSIFIAAVSLQQGALPRRLLTDVHCQPWTHRSMHTENSSNSWKNADSLKNAHMGTHNHTHATHLDLSALKSLIPSAGPQIWTRSSRVNFNKSEPMQRKLKSSHLCCRCYNITFMIQCVCLFVCVSDNVCVPEK